MKFASYLHKNHQKGSDHVKLCYQISSANHNFPSNLSSKMSVFNWLKKNDYNSEVVNKFHLAWNEFESKPYCTIGKATKKGKK